MPSTVPLLIGGRLESSTSDRTGEVFNPSTGRVQAQVPFCTAAEIDRAVRCGRRRAAGVERDPGGGAGRASCFVFASWSPPASRSWRRW